MIETVSKPVSVLLNKLLLTFIHTGCQHYFLVLALPLCSAIKIYEPFRSHMDI